VTFTDKPRPTAAQAGRYIKDLLERLAKTFVQAFLGTLIAANWFSVDQIRDVSTLQAAGLAGIAAVLSVVTSILSKYVNREDSASLAPGV
jgi:Putative lactococcus lactis phage r1t holin